jgi:predicted ester cyclase
MCEENKAVVGRLINEVLLGGDLGVVAQIVAPDYRPHDPSNPGRPGGVEGVRAFAAMFHTGLSEREYLVEGMIADGDLVMHRWTMKGVHTGDFLGLAPTRKRIGVTRMDAFRVVAGKIAESWAAPDALGMLQQLGVLPPLADMSSGSPEGASGQP